MFINNEKLFYEDEGYDPYLDGEVFMVPATLIERAFNTTVDNVANDIPSVKKDGRLYVSLKDYCEKAIHKIKLYEKNGYYTGDKFIFTLETAAHPVTAKELELKITKYLL